MCRYIETIRVCDGKPQNLAYHQARMTATMQQLWHGCSVPDLASCLTDAPQKGTVKARVVYDNHGICMKSYTDYKVRELKSLRIMHNDDICYALKSENRDALTALLNRRNGCDDILIARRGLITDTSYTNVALLKDGHWYTPSVPLLKGTMRQWLIDNGKIEPCPIPVSTLHDYQQVALINAMMPLGTLILNANSIKESEE
jgi:4-amino-4-deoxychorismate lyase